MGIIKSDYRVNLPVFEGPLDLLLSLIEREELDITRISLAQVADQYLSYLSQVEETRPERLAEFLVIAAKLVLIKSEALLPRPPRATQEGEPDTGDDLVKQLKLYKQFKEIAQRLKNRQELGLRTYVRLAPPPKLNAQPDLTGVTLNDLLRAVQTALELEPPAPLVEEVVTKRKITVKEQIVLIHQRLETDGRTTFQQLLTEAGGRLEIAVTLLATLELVKRRFITIHQERIFGPIVMLPLDPDHSPEPDLATNNPSA